MRSWAALWSGSRPFPLSPARARWPHRTAPAPRFPRGADDRAQLHDRLIEEPRRFAMTRDQRRSGGPNPSITAAGVAPGVEGAPNDPGDVGVHRRCGAFVRKACHRARRVAADARQLDQLRRVGRDDPVPPVHDLTGEAVKIGGAAIVPQALPGFPHRGPGCRCQMANGGESLQKPGVVGLDSGHLGLLQHDLGHQHPVRVTSASPGQVPSVPPVPAAQQTPESKVPLGGSF